MSTFDHAVSIHPYFRIQEGQRDACKGFLTEFCERVAQEDMCLYYNFTFKDDALFCREAYHNADGVFAHLENCGAVLAEFLKIADVTRIEIHGPAAELEKLKEAFAQFNPDYFVCECGIGN